jgi:hypothetical protein
MQQTTNNNIKIVRLQSGEDVMADYHADEENGTVLLDNPMHIIFKRISSGQTVMMMMPWLPIELIKENNAVIYDSDILTIIEPKEDLINYYGQIVMSAQEKMENETNIFGEDDEDDDDEEQIQEVFDAVDFFEMMKEKKKNKLH